MKRLIVFTSDHGATFESGNQGTSAALDSNRPFRGQKRTLWEGGIRVPALACWPGRIPAGVRTQEVMHLTDLLPTFVAAAGGEVDPAWHVDGINLLAAWTGKAPAPERTLFWEWRSEGSDQLAALAGPIQAGDHSRGKARTVRCRGRPRRAPRHFRSASGVDESNCVPSSTPGSKPKLVVSVSRRFTRPLLIHTWRRALQVRTCLESRSPPMRTRFLILTLGWPP